MKAEGFWAKQHLKVQVAYTEKKLWHGIGATDRRQFWAIPKTLQSPLSAHTSH